MEISKNEKTSGFFNKIKMFGFFQKKIEKTDNAIKINNEYASIVRETNNSSIENAKNSIDIMRKAKKAKKIENREDVALKFGALRRNVINLFKYDNEKISDQDMRKSIIKKYDAKRVKAGIAKYDENGNADMDKTVEWTAENNSRKELNSSIRAEKKAIWGSRVGLVKNEIKRIHIDNKLQSRKNRFKALGIVTSPLKYATEGIVQGAKTVSQKVTQVKRGTKAGAIKFIRSAGVRYEGGDKLPRKFMEALGAKVSQSKEALGAKVSQSKIGQAIGASLKAVKETALEARGRYANKALNRQQNRQEKLQRWAAARPVRE